MREKTVSESESERERERVIEAHLEERQDKEEYKRKSTKKKGK